jgi:hypothetical protein
MFLRNVGTHLTDMRCDKPTTQHKKTTNRSIQNLTRTYSLKGTATGQTGGYTSLITSDALLRGGELI